ncbi:MAG: hypothetical protein RBT40_07550 [Petrimonas sp.]|jgi:DNA polymerase III alpha subunit|nr:hypothetical protein [Petrimonas sp.]
MKTHYAHFVPEDEFIKYPGVHHTLTVNSLIKDVIAPGLTGAVPFSSQIRELGHGSNLSYVCITGNPLGRFRAFINKFKTESLREIAKHHEKTDILTAVIITRVIGRRMTISGKPWAILEVTDGSAKVEALIFSKKFSKYGHLCVKGTPVLIRGHTSKNPYQKKSGRYTIMIDGLYRLPEEDE